LGDGADFAEAVEENGARAGGALVEGEYEFHDRTRMMNRRRGRRGMTDANLAKDPSDCPSVKRGFSRSGRCRLSIDCRWVLGSRMEIGQAA
jgi:hypothetical protein